MSYNGSGVFNINTAGQPVVTGTVISSTAFNALTADLATGLSTCVTKDGQTNPTANLPMAGYKLTGLGTGSAATDSATLAQVQSGTVSLIGSISGTDTITGSLSPALTAYAAGQMFWFVSAGANTGAVTLNINGLGAKSVTRDGSTALVSGDIASGEVVMVVYDGTRFQAISPNTFNGVLPIANGGTGLTTTPTNGQLDIGNGTGFTRATLTAGSGVSIANGSGSITISATGLGGTVTSVGGTGTVNGITLTGTVTSAGNLTLGGTLSGVSLTTQVTGTLPIANGGTGSTSTTYCNLASNVTGTLPVANGGTGQTSYTNGQLLIGNTTGNTLTKATLTAGTNISITNGTGSITIAAAGLPTMNVVSGTTQSATAGNQYVLTNAAATTVTLPASPSAGDTVYVTVANSLTTNVVDRNGNNIMSLAENMTLDAPYASAQLRYADATRGWVLT